jgi:hypothetical protein
MRVNARRWIAVLAVLMIVGFASGDRRRTVAAANPPETLITPPRGQTPQPSLRDLLEKDLQARLPADFAFVDRVIQRVSDGDLPEKLVRTTYYWARRKPRRRFQYFRRALVYRASRLGVDLQ